MWRDRQPALRYVSARCCVRLLYPKSVPHPNSPGRRAHNKGGHACWDLITAQQPQPQPLSDCRSKCSNSLANQLQASCAVLQSPTEQQDIISMRLRTQHPPNAHVAGQRDMCPVLPHTRCRTMGHVPRPASQTHTVVGTTGGQFCAGELSCNINTRTHTRTCNDAHTGIDTRAEKASAKPDLGARPLFFVCPRNFCSCWGSYCTHSQHTQPHARARAHTRCCAASCRIRAHCRQRQNAPASVRALCQGCLSCDNSDRSSLACLLSAAAAAGAGLVLQLLSRAGFQVTAAMLGVLQLNRVHRRCGWLDGARLLLLAFLGERPVSRVKALLVLRSHASTATGGQVSLLS